MNNNNDTALKVLVADDSVVNLQLLDAFLKKLGHRVILAGNGEQAVAIFEHERPDVVLMDMMMPDVGDGMSATPRIKALCGDCWVPVIFVTRLSSDEDLIAGLQAGGDDYIVKPVRLPVLEAKLRAVARTIALQRKLNENTARLQRYRDVQEMENTLARETLDKMLYRAGLDDTRLRYSVDAAENFSGDVVAAARSPQGRFYVMLADATGHGLAAAISVLPALSVFYGMVARDLPLSMMVDEMNTKVRAAVPLGRFVAAILVCLDEVSGEGEIWSGGMPDALQVDAQGHVASRFASHQVPLGIVASTSSYASTERFDWRSRGQLVVCSDGVCEARNGQGEAFGLDRVTTILERTPPEQRFEAVRAAIFRHMDDRPAHDDASLVVIDCVADVMREDAVLAA